MVYFCADDYGLCHPLSVRIQQCIDKGGLNKVSVFPNFDTIDFGEIWKQKKVRVSLHLNLVEGKCMSNAETIPLLAEKNGTFKCTFVGLLKLQMFHRKEFETQVYQEIKAQVLFWKSILPKDAPFCVDSHQHTHMIPAVFRALLQVLDEEKIHIEYLRIPAEPMLPYLKTPSLYGTYCGVNLAKQWLLKFLWMMNQGRAKACAIPTAYFFGVLFSGKMDEKRVRKILPQYIKMAERSNRDVEVLLHPGYLQEETLDFRHEGVVFEKFYRSENRKTEFDTAMKIFLKEV